ncbi:MAG: site-specific DNA-methyltransferase [Mycobacterium sp.]
MRRNHVIYGDVREKLAELPADSVHCCVTSPPYWGLRDYHGHADQIGSEPTYQEFVTTMVDVFREVRRVLRDDGTLWLNLGDSYTSGGRTTFRSGASRNKGHDVQNGQRRPGQPSDLKPKDLVGIPWRVAIALQADGWWLRADIIWAKPSPMPGSQRDRPTTAHEYIFLLTKSARYWYDCEAIKTESNRGGERAWYAGGSGSRANAMGREPSGNERPESRSEVGHRANKRSVWTVASQGYSGAHFACYPPKLIEPCILAGCPEQCCPACGRGYVPTVESERVPTRPGTDTKIPSNWATGSGSHGNQLNDRNKAALVGNRDPQRHVTTTRVTGYAPGCECEPVEPVRGIVLDPFMGSGTTAQVAQNNGRDWIGIELNRENAELIANRTQQKNLF